jgi:AraC-like DNA-binding protein
MTHAHQVIDELRPGFESGDPMFAHDYLALRLVRLKPSEEWLNRGRSFSFLFPMAGAGTFVSAVINHPLAPGDVLALPEDQGGKVCAPEAGELAFCCFALRLEHLYPLFGSNELSLVQNVTGFFRMPRLYPAPSPLAQECHRLLATAPPLHNLDHRGQLLRVVTTVLTAEFKDARRQRGGFLGAEQHMIEVLEELLVDDIMDLTVQELADKFHCSQRYLNSLFHQHFGFSVGALRMEMRLIKAVSLLRNRNAKVIHVAEQCGFSHLGLFNDCFKRRFGASPGRWRDASRTARAQLAGLLAATPDCQVLANGLCPFCPSAGKPASTDPAGPKPARLRPSRLRKARSPLGPSAPKRRAPSLEAATPAKLETTRAELGTASLLESQKGNGL